MTALERRAARRAEARSYRIGQAVRVLDTVSGNGEVTGYRDLEEGDRATVALGLSDDYANDAGMVTIQSADGDFYLASVEEIEPDLTPSERRDFEGRPMSGLLSPLSVARYADAVAWIAQTQEGDVGTDDGFRSSVLLVAAIFRREAHQVGEDVFAYRRRPTREEIERRGSSR